MAFYATGTTVNDFAALLSDASVYQFLARPKRDLDGMTLLLPEIESALDGDPNLQQCFRH